MAAICVPPRPFHPARHPAWGLGDRLAKRSHPIPVYLARLLFRDAVQAGELSARVNAMTSADDGTITLHNISVVHVFRLAA